MRNWYFISAQLRSQLSFCRCLVVTMVSYGCFVSRLCSVSESSPDGTLHLDLSSRVVKPWEDSTFPDIFVGHCCYPRETLQVAAILEKSFLYLMTLVVL
ncbi:hypothetical protein Y1Q_0013214 [Alligator mississippiensis]|uniref:Uncharacterized protein n=1 Tax=Alligator mississippiensis TaxID=8496 RepID=A0A151NTZ3_ALLMI|nr:hypothetical protein Y1Q_0013214 [Alligator mississippiensis]